MTHQSDDQSEPEQTTAHRSTDDADGDASSQQQVTSKPTNSSLPVHERNATTDDQSEPKQSTAHWSTDDTGVYPFLSTDKHPYAHNKSHNKLCKCSLCPFFGTHLARHIALKHGGKELAEVSRLVVKADQRQKGASETEVNQNRQHHQCGYENCTAIVTR